jgi:hypothetical protein
MTTRVAAPVAAGRVEPAPGGLATIAAPKGEPIDVTTYAAIAAFILALAGGALANRMRVRRTFLRYYAD